MSNSTNKLRIKIIIRNILVNILCTIIFEFENMMRFFQHFSPKKIKLFVTENFEITPKINHTKC